VAVEAIWFPIIAFLYDWGTLLWVAGEGSGPNRPVALAERARGGAVWTTETEVVGLGPPGTKGALEGLDIIVTCAIGFSVGLGGEVFWISVLGKIVGCEADVKDDDVSLPVCCVTLKDVFLTLTGEGKFLQGLLGEDGPTDVISFCGLPLSTGFSTRTCPLMFCFFCGIRTSSSYQIEEHHQLNHVHIEIALKGKDKSKDIFKND